MALRRPPEHRVDAPIIFVHPRDEAWDREKIETEVKAMRVRGEDPRGHPYEVYRFGESRYDLEAEYTVLGQVRTPRHYLDDQLATLWNLRRLDHMLWYAINAQWKAAQRRAEDPDLAYLRALAHGVVSVENGPKLQGPPNQLTSEDLRLLYEMRFIEVVDGNEITVDPAIDTGRAVYTASMPLTVTEGKP